MLNSDRSQTKALGQAALWSALLNWSRLGLNAIVFLLLARWLSLEEIGAFAAAQAPLMFFQSILRSVVPDAVVQSDSPTENHLSTLFWYSLLTGFGFSIICFVLSLFATEWFGDPRVSLFMLILSPLPLFIAFSAVSEGLLRKRLEMRSLTVRTVLSSVLAGIPAIAVGLTGGGGWALTVFSLVSIIAASILTFQFIEWRPRWNFDRRYALAVSPILGALTGRHALSALVFPVLQWSVSLNLSISEGAAFQIAQKFLTLADSLLVAPVRFFILPVLSLMKSDAGQFKSAFLKAASIGSLIASPVYLGLAAVALPLLIILIGPDKASLCSRTFSAFCFYGPPGMLAGLIGQALVSKGHARALFVRTLLMFMIAVIPCLLASFHSLTLVAISYSVFGGFVGLAMSVPLARRYCDVPTLTFMSVVTRPLIAAGVMFSLVTPLCTALGAFLAPLPILLVAVPVGGLAYCLFVFVLNPMEARDFMDRLTQIVVRRVNLRP